MSRAKLSPEQVVAIRADTRTQKDLAIAFGVSDHTILMVKRRRTWNGGKVGRPRRQQADRSALTASPSQEQRP